MVRSRPSMAMATISTILMTSLMLMMLPTTYGTCALLLVFEWKRPWITFVISPDTTKLNLDDDTLSLPNPPRNKLYLPYCWGCTQYSYNLSSTSPSPSTNVPIIPPPLDTELKEENNLTDQCPAEHTFLPIEGDRFEVDVSPQHITIDEELLLALIIIPTSTPSQHNYIVDEDSPPSYENLYTQQVFLLSVLLLCAAAIMINNLNEGEGVSNDNITAMKRNLEVDTDLVNSNDNATNDEEEEDDFTPRAVDPPASNPLEHVLKVLNIGNDKNKKDSKKEVLEKKNVNTKKEKDKMKKDIKKIKRRSTIASCDSTADYPLKENQPLSTREEKRQPAGRRRPTLVKQTSQKVYGKGEKLLQVV